MSPFRHRPAASPAPRPRGPHAVTASFHNYNTSFAQIQPGSGVIVSPRPHRGRFGAVAQALFSSLAPLFLPARRVFLPACPLRNHLIFPRKVLKTGPIPAIFSVRAGD